MTPPPAAATTAGRTAPRRPPQRPPRRVSGPTRPVRQPRALHPAGGAPVPGRARPHGPRTTAPRLAPAGALARRAAVRIGDARLLDRLIGGRAWIAIVAVALLGIVFMQVSLLRLNSGIGRAVTAADTLERQNASLRGSISELGASDRIQDAAAAAGMVAPAAGDVHYLDARGADAKLAASRMKAPSEAAVQAAAGPGGGPGSASAAGAGAAGQGAAVQSTAAQATAEAKAPATGEQGAGTTQSQPAAGATPSAQTPSAQTPAQTQTTAPQTGTGATAGQGTPAATTQTAATAAGGATAAVGR